MLACRRVIILIFIMAACFAMVCPSSSAAPVAPVAIGESSGLLAALVASLMGVDYSLSTVDTSTLNSFFSTSVLSNPIWASRIYGGLATLNIGLDALNSLSSFASSRISSDSIPDNSSGSLPSFISYSFDGMPLNGVFRGARVSPPVSFYLSPNSSGSFNYGSISLSYTVDDFSRFYYTVSFGDRSVSSNFRINAGDHLFQYNWSGSSFPVAFGMRGVNDTSWTASSLIGGLGQPFSEGVSVDYSSGVVDTSATSGLPSTGGMTVTFPSNANSIPELLRDLLSTYRDNPSFIDSQLVDDAGLPIDYSNTIADEPYSSLAGDLGDVEGAVHDVHGTLGGFASAAQQAWNTIDTNIGNIGRTITENLGLVGDRITSAVGSASSAVTGALSGILSAVQDLAGSIAAGDSTFFDNIVDAIAVPFSPILNIFKSGVGIWRYVVSWLGNISGPFNWSLSALGSAGAIFLSPLYASFAGAIVIAVYRRFGR